MGAIYLDGNLKSARNFIFSTLLDNHQQLLQNKSYINYKSLLLEYAQARGLPAPVYETASEHGPDHDKIFNINVSVEQFGKAEGSGHSKKLAEQNAAQNLLEACAPDILNI